MPSKKATVCTFGRHVAKKEEIQDRLGYSRNPEEEKRHDMT